MKNLSRLENLIYLALWGMLFASPVLSMLVRTVDGTATTFSWSEIFMVWQHFAIYLVLFAAHNFFLAPLLVHEHKKVLYSVLTVATVIVFTFYQCSHHPQMPPGALTEQEMTAKYGERPPLPPHAQKGQRPPLPPHAQKGQRPPLPPDMDEGRRPPVIIGEHDIVAVVFLLLMFGMNIAVKGFFKSRDDQKRLADLERENLTQQLEYLKYQLNPHFLMNTLNNIHALVDIDAEQSKEAIIQLSKILRYVLYESNHDRVPACKEIEFMENYTTLMRMRYTDKLRFSVIPPEDAMNMQLPPLLFISFVENAFKHGVSYQQDSFIEIVCKNYTGKTGTRRLLWTCRNSKHPSPNTHHPSPNAHHPSPNTSKEGGVGMVNIRRRLDLIYGKDYSLGISDTDDTYEVILDIPLEA